MVVVFWWTVHTCKFIHSMYMYVKRLHGTGCAAKFRPTNMSLNSLLTVIWQVFPVHSQNLTIPNWWRTSPITNFWFAVVNTQNNNNNNNNDNNNNGTVLFCIMRAGQSCTGHFTLFLSIYIGLYVKKINCFTINVQYGQCLAQWELNNKLTKQLFTSACRLQMIQWGYRTKNHSS